MSTFPTINEPNAEQLPLKAAHTDSPYLPAEVQDLCILALADMAFEFVDDRHGPHWEVLDASAKEALRACLFVSSRVRHHAASRLFHTIDIVPGSTNFDSDVLEVRKQLRLLNAISTTTVPLGIARFVKIIKIQVFDEIYHKNVFDNFGILNGFLLNVVCGHSPSLKRLTFRGYPGLLWSSFCPEFQRLFKKVLFLPTLLELTIANVWGIPKLVLCGSTSVTEALFHNISITGFDEGYDIDPLPALQELTLDANLDAVVMKCLGTRGIGSHHLRKARFNINTDDGFHRAARVLGSSYATLLHLTIRVPNKDGWYSHGHFTLERFQNLRDLHFACDVQCVLEDPNHLNLATTLHNIASLMRTAPKRPLATLLLKFNCNITTSVDAMSLNNPGPWSEIASILYNLHLPRKREDILQVLIHFLIIVDMERIDVAESVDEQVLKTAFRQLSTQCKGFHIQVYKQLQLETS